VKSVENSLSRREFIRFGFHSAGLCGVTAAALASSIAESVEAATASTSPFAYEVDRLSQIDPQLLRYEQVGRISGFGAEPKRIAIGPDDRVYVATKAGVEILDPVQGKTGEIPLSSPARCVAVAGDGTIYVGLRAQLQVFSSKGQSLTAWEIPAKKAWLTGLTVGAKDVFVADSASRVIYRYDRTGKLLGRIGEKNPARNVPGLIVPSPYLDVKLGRDGLLRVNNPGRHCVHLFTSDGDLELSWGKPSLKIEGFCGCCNPIGLALLPDGRCITSEKGLPRVKVFSNDHTLDSVVAGPELFRDNGRAGQVSDQSDGTLGGLDTAVDSKGRVFILDIVARDVRVMRRKA